MLDIRIYCQSRGEASPDLAVRERQYQDSRIAGAIADWLHNLAKAAADDFERFNEDAFWKTHGYLCARFPVELKRYRTQFDQRLNEAAGINPPTTQILSVETRMLDHIKGDESPRRTLLNTGAFSERWVETYFELMEEASAKWRDEHLWPRELVAAVHIASLYFPLDYQVWREFKGAQGARNEQTERDLARIRTRSETFLLTPIVRL